MFWDLMGCFQEKSIILYKDFKQKLFYALNYDSKRKVIFILNDRNDPWCSTTFK